MPVWVFGDIGDLKGLHDGGLKYIAEAEQEDNIR
jgi:hypothetical protein